MLIKLCYFGHFHWQGPIASLFKNKSCLPGLTEGSLVARRDLSSRFVLRER